MIQTSWSAPSNIALIKYWGKHGIQLPNNPSISFTLDKSRTHTHVKYEPGASALDLQFLFEGKENIEFAKRTISFLNSINRELPFLQTGKLYIESSNTFPHSTGIASSASAMATLALCLCEIHQKVTDSYSDKIAFLKHASHIARLGSGSACRSIYPYLAQWGQTDSIPSSSDEFAIPVSDVHVDFTTYLDAILIIDSDEKKVSSSAGHQLMEKNPFAEIRYKQAHTNLAELLIALKTGDLDTFIEIVELEALMLHALMMTSQPSYILIRPNTLQGIEKIQLFRQETKIPVCFTLDAGPNIHLLYPKKYQTEVEAFISQQLIMLCEDERVIFDCCGEGPISL